MMIQRESLSHCRTFKAVVGGPAGPAMARPLFLPRKFILVFFAFQSHSLTTALWHYMAGPLFKSRL